MGEEQFSYRVLPDEIRVIRYSELRRRVLAGERADLIAREVGMTPSAMYYHLAKMGLKSDPKTRHWYEIPAE